MGLYGVGYGGVPAYGGGAPVSALSHGSQPVMGGGMDFVEPDEVAEMGRCHHKKPDGTFCLRFPKKGSLYCPPHKTVDETLNLLNDALGD